MDIQTLILVAAAFAFGGILKGATGAGAPIIAVPLLTLLYDVRFAVAVFVIPNAVPNIWQAWSYRGQGLKVSFVVSLAVAGGIGAGIGSVALAGLSAETLTAGVAIALILYVGFRLLKPGWMLGHELASRIVFPVGLVAGFLQGATGLSAPVSITFLNAMKLERGQFIATISVFFVALAVVQLPFLAYYGIMTGERFIYSVLALIPLALFMPLGTWLGQHMSRKLFDMAIMALLSSLAIKLAVEAFS